MILGRFNYLTVRKDKYSIIFTPKRGSVIFVIACNLERDEAIDIMEELNEVLKDDYEKEEELDAEE